MEEKNLRTILVIADVSQYVDYAVIRTNAPIERLKELKNIFKNFYKVECYWKWRELLERDNYVFDILEHKSPIGSLEAIINPIRKQYPDVEEYIMKYEMIIIPILD